MRSTWGNAIPVRRRCKQRCRPSRVTSWLFNIRTKFARTFGQPAGECGWSEEPRLSRGQRVGARGSQAQLNYGGNERRSAPRSAFFRGDKWTSPQVKSFNLLRSKSEANLNRLIKPGRP